MQKFNIVDARAIMRTSLIAIFADDPIATQFLSSFFKMKESRSKSVSIEVQRLGEQVAIDVPRGTEGNRNTFDDFSAKSFIPPYFKEYFDATELDFYEVIFGQPNVEVDAGVIAMWTEEIARRLRILMNKIKRRKELAASEVLLTGIVTLNTGQNIDFKRKVDSIKDLGATNYWDDAGVDPNTSMEVGMNFIRQEGKSQGGVFNVTAGSLAMSALMNNDAFMKKANFRRVDLVNLNSPQSKSDGKLHGEITVGSYKAFLWSYPEFYTHPTTKLSTAYVPEKKIIITPEKPNFIMAHAAVPVSHGRGTAQEHIQFQPGEFVFRDYIDPKLDKHIFDVKSSFLPIPVGVDKIYTALVVS